MRSGPIAFAMLVLASAPGVQAQLAGDGEAVKPYSTLTFGVAGTRVIAPGRLHDYWEAGSGARVDVYTPFHVGELGASVTTLQYAARAAAQPSFRAFLVALDWRFSLPSPGWIRPRLSVTAGDFLTIFDGVEVKGLGKESEVFVGGSAGLAVPLGHRTSLSAGVTALHVFTSTPIRMTVGSVGIAYTVGTPRWVRAVIE